MYRRVQLRTVVQVDGRAACVDTLDLCPSRAAPDAPGLLGGADYVGTLILAAPAADAERLAFVLDVALAAQTGVLAGAGSLPGECGVLVRVLAGRLRDAAAALRTAWGAARLELGGGVLPPERK